MLYWAINVRTKPLGSSKAEVLSPLGNVLADLQLTRVAVLGHLQTAKARGAVFRAKLCSPPKIFCRSTGGTRFRFVRDTRTWSPIISNTEDWTAFFRSIAAWNRF